MKFGIIVFPGSNCERDCADAITRYLNEKAVYLWHQDTDLQGAECIILPGGFSYGDYLRSGAIARFSPIMQSVQQFAEQGRPVLGICNGFQILTEAGLLPGALRRNEALRFLCDRSLLTVENNQTIFTQTYQANQVIELPVAHAEGNYYADADTIKRLEDQNQVVFRYQDDINGSVNRIAGIVNNKGNVLGMMPHPERNLWPSELWSGEGRKLFASIISAIGAPLG
jgi:phosphoribosylformylglycinamidine synthase subunit PurQ / glutaminase